MRSNQQLLHNLHERISFDVPRRKTSDGSGLSLRLDDDPGLDDGVGHDLGGVLDHFLPLGSRGLRRLGRRAHLVGLLPLGDPLADLIPPVGLTHGGGALEAALGLVEDGASDGGGASSEHVVEAWTRLLLDAPL